jgi:hypothetical protein
MVDPLASEAELQHAVARADRARRGRETARRLWTMAPAAAAACLVVAIGGRLRGWTPFVTVFVIGAAAIALGAYVLLARRQRALSDAEVSSIDADAGLKGELRSAHWFASQTAEATAEGDDWIRLHLARAAERVRGIDWSGLYPPPSAGRAKLATGVMAVAAVALAMLVPGGARLDATVARKAANAAPKRPAVIVALPPELRKALEAMLTTAESANGRALTAAEVRDLLATLDALAHRDPAKQTAAANVPGERQANKADLKALAERARKASESTNLEPQVRDALADMAQKLNEAGEDENAMDSRDAQDAAADKDKQDGQAQASKSAGGKQDSAGAQSVQEASDGSAAGIVMMTTDDASDARSGGLGLGGGSADKTGAGQFADLGAALRKETVEASVDNAGDNVPITERRNTEQSDAATAYSHAAAAAAERGSSTAPPPVPESRRAAVKSYFIRKQ